jgi:hypothetical protein
VLAAKPASRKPISEPSPSPLPYRGRPCRFRFCFCRCFLPRPPRCCSRPWHSMYPRISISLCPPDHRPVPFKFSVRGKPVVARRVASNLGVCVSDHVTAFKTCRYSTYRNKVSQRKYFGKWLGLESTGLRPLDIRRTIQPATIPVTYSIYAQPEHRLF